MPCQMSFRQKETTVASPDYYIRQNFQSQKNRWNMIFHDELKFKQYLCINLSWQRILKRKLWHKENIYTQETQESNHLKTNHKEENHKPIIPPTKTKIARTNYHWSLISLTTNGFNSPIKWHKLTGWTCSRFQNPTAYKKHTSVTETDTISD